MTGWKRRLPLTQRLLTLTAVALLPALAALIYLIVSLHRDREREVHDLALRTGELATLEMDRIISGAEGTLFALARSRLIRTFDTPDCDSYLAEVSAGLPQLGAVLAADSEGRVRCASEPLPGSLAVDTRAYFEKATAGEALVVGEFTRSQTNSDVAYLPLAQPIVEDGEVVGVLVGGLDLRWLNARLRDRDLAPGSALTIADREGVIIAREPEAERFVGTRIPDDFQPLVRSEQAGTREVVSQDGTRRVIGYHPPAATGLGLYVSAGLSTERAFAPIYASTYRSLALAGAGTAAAFIFAWVAGNRLVREPIHRLVSTVEAWRSGDITARTGIKADGNELSTLALAIDRYMDELVADRAARRQAEVHRDLLFREMDHRIKNILATVQAVAKQTLKGKATPEGLRDFEGRLGAMAETHKILLSENWQRADLRATIEAALRPFGLDGGDRLSLSGPPLEITARAALALSMVVHELGTNAAKYGALSHGTGKVGVAWHLGAGEEGERLVLTWTEHDGPPVEEPRRSGFGSRLIQAALASEFGAEVDLTFPSTGVVFTLEADARRVLVDPEPEDAAA